MEQTTTVAKQENPEVDTTKFLNIDDKDFDIYINGKLARHVKAGEEQVLPLFVALAGAKHLVDRVLQEKHKIYDTLRDTPMRRDLFARILPERAEEKGIKPLSEADFRAEILKRMDEQSKQIATLTGVTPKDNTEELKELKNQIAGLKMALGRKNKKDKVASPEA